MNSMQPTPTTLDQIDLSAYPATEQAALELLSVWPEHERTMSQSLAHRSGEVMRDTESAAESAIKIGLDHFDSFTHVCRGYRYFCEKMILASELHFRRTGRYELSRFSEAYKNIYSKPDIMENYMNGLLLSGVFWRNHALALTFYRTEFLSLLPADFDHLEIGPGHGALLRMTAQHGNYGSISGWDVSKSSIAATRRSLQVLGVHDSVNLLQQDMRLAAAQPQSYDSIVLSELLEHLEDPLEALKSMVEVLRPGGYMLVNMPTNSPAPDHLYLVDSPTEVNQLITDAGLTIVRSAVFPMTGYSYAQCMKHKLTLTCVAVAVRA